jgi:hypothetical protein
VTGQLPVAVPLQELLWVEALLSALEKSEQA